MGKPVTVDSDDLKVVVMATGVVKEFEKIIEQHKHDPFVSKDEHSITSAHNRLAAEMVRAERGENHPTYNEPISVAAMNLLTDINRTINDRQRGRYSVDPAWMRPIGGTAPTGFSELRQKGMIEIGSVFEYVLWQSDPKQTRIDKAEFRARLTDRGEKMLMAQATKPGSSLQ